MNSMEATERRSLLETFTDEEVVQKVLSGDQSLFELLMRRHNQRLYRAVRSILKNAAEAEDVMQQAYVNAYTHLSQFSGEAKFSTWLLRIATNEAFARLRRRGLILIESECGEPCEEPIRQSTTTSPTPEAETLNRELQAVLEEQILALPANYRAIFIFREVEGLSTAETAESLGLTEDVVKTRLHRARIMLRNGLFKRAGVSLESLFTFMNRRCDLLVDRVFSNLALL